ncbi:MFS transporter [Nitratireductor alexandrii]|uniref:MFS transporter n=1 Tax=Nitratireductor alexandrii TaxID=2448161 RepID=UPI000FD6C1EE|nr:MFS transporter [Nitratireductor alexandrii]
MADANRWPILAIVSSALLMIVTDMTVLYTALPTLTLALEATANEKLWIINAYPLVVAGLLPGLGTLGDKLGHKKIFIAGLMVYGAASLGAAFAPSAGILIAWRVALAVGAAMMMPATLSIIRLTFTDEKERAFAIGIWASVASGGAALGPVLGGLLLEYFWWGSVFLINVPIVLVALLAGTLLLPARAGDSRRHWDLIGSVQIMVGLIGVVFAIKEASRQSPLWATVVASGLIGAAALFLFVQRQRRSAAPLIDFSLFTNPRFSSGVATAMVASAVIIGVELAFSQRLQLVLDYSPLQAGLLILPIPVAAFIAGPVAGLVLPYVAPSHFLSGTLLTTALALAAFLLVRHHEPTMWILPLAVMGFGIGAAMTAASNAIMLSAPEERAGMAASVEEVSYELGGALGIALLGSLISVLYSRALVLPGQIEIAPQARDSLDEALMLASRLPMNDAIEVSVLARSAFDQAFTGVIAAATACLIIVSVFVWHIRPRR